MPFYEYQCEDCETKIEYFQSITDEPKTVCPTCKGHLQRMVTKGAGIIFKGTGFYETDYKRKETSANGSNGNGHHPLRTKTSEEQQSDTASKPAEKSEDKKLAKVEPTD